MTQQQWERLLAVVRNRKQPDVAVALIADSPSIPGLTGVTTMDYLCNQEAWLRANLAVMQRFPDVIFLPGTWVEYGVAIEPSAFGCPLKWSQTGPPAAMPILAEASDVAKLSLPNPEVDGLMPVTLEWQRNMRSRLADHGQVVKIVTARGPLAIASQVRGVTNLLMDIKVEPEAAKDLIELCCQTAIMWLRAQSEVYDEVEAVELHDDIVGMLSPNDYEEFAHPYLERIFSAFPEHVHIYHNDMPGIRFVNRLADAGMDVFNFSHLLDISEVDSAIGDRVCLMGNVAPIDVLVHETPEQVLASAEACMSSVRGGLLLSAGGGLSPGVKPENIDALVEAAARHCITV
ncbi:MAG: uroporphyrinogen decarboxylase family protein [Armatimonadota bacterium]|nr:uroporphyrinogen decarboxylase [bacterium]